MADNYKIYISAALGLTLLASSTLSLALVRNGYRAYASPTLLIETVAFIAGLLSAGFTLLFSVIWLTDKQWSKSIQGVISVAIFAVCFVVAASRGGGFMYAR